MSDSVQEYLQQLHQPQHDNAYFSLLEADEAIVPQLIEAYHSQSDPHLKATLVEIIWQHRSSSSLEFLAQTLLDEHPEVWKAALDGIVGIGGDASPAILIQHRDQLRSKSGSADIRLRWLEEAIQQLTCANLA